MDEQKLRQEVKAGEEAKAAAENKAVSGWWGTAKNAVVDELEIVDLSNTTKVVALVSRLQSVAVMRGDFNRCIAKGENAKSKLGHKPIKKKFFNN